MPRHRGAFPRNVTAQSGALGKNGKSVARGGVAPARAAAITASSVVNQRLAASPNQRSGDRFRQRSAAPPQRRAAPPPAAGVRAALKVAVRLRPRGWPPAGLLGVAAGAWRRSCVGGCPALRAGLAGGADGRAEHAFCFWQRVPAARLEKEARLEGGVPPSLPRHFQEQVQEEERAACLSRASRSC